MTGQCAIESVSEVLTVSAGTFEGAVKVSCKGTGRKNIRMQGGICDGSKEVDQWFVAGIGMVKTIMTDEITRAGWQGAKVKLFSLSVAAELVSFNKK